MKVHDRGLLGQKYVQKVKYVLMYGCKTSAEGMSMYGKFKIEGYFARNMSSRSTMGFFMDEETSKRGNECL